MHRTVLVALGVVLGYAAFEWGGVLRTDQYKYLLVLGLLAIVLSVGRSRDEWAPLPSRVARWAAVLLPAYVLLQVVPLPVAVLRVLSPARAAGVDALAPVGARMRLASLSVSPTQTFQHFLLVSGYVLIFLLVRELTQAAAPPGICPDLVGRAADAGPALRGIGATSSMQSRWLAIWPIVAIGALEAVLGLWQHFAGNGEQVQWGTYVNRDHYASFLGMALPFAVVYPVAVLCRAPSRRRWPQRRFETAISKLETGNWEISGPESKIGNPKSKIENLKSKTRTHHSPLAPSLAACGVWALAAVMLVGITYSLSRMGFVAALFSLFVMGTLIFGARPLSWVVKSRKRRATAVGLVAALVLAGFVFLPPDKLILRFAQIASVEGLTAEGRIKLWAETIPLIKAYPVFGCGLGGYETAFSRFKVSGVLLTDDFAHNDYLQLLAELGLVGLLIVAALASSVVRMAFSTAVESADGEEHYFAVAGAGALAAILLHSLVDFNLYIPANAMLLAWIAGMMAGLRFQGRRMENLELHGHLKVIDVEAVEVGWCR